MNYKELKNQNEIYFEKLPKEYKEKLVEIGTYLEVNNISIYNIEKIKADIINIMLEGANRGEKVENVIGENNNIFAKEILDNVPKMNFIEKFFNFIYIARFAVLGILTAYIFGGISEILDDKSITEAKIKFDYLAFIIVVVFAIIMYKLNKKRGENIFNKEKNTRYVFLMIINTVVVIIAVLLHQQFKNLTYFYYPEIISWIIIFILIVLSIISTFIVNKNN
ncbi:MAG: DUF1048 domain-containing protein [Miniphocaeibacter sp.]|uniref:DUF1048 domain-containing protein n=1 Tax=Miniphocaeibacter sp. TaxID=3100973 RepID=UPI001832EE6F|nr:DUF1048 domain-containing protein [Gallicola sp.]